MPDTFGLSIDTINKLCTVFSKYSEIEEAIIYGSGAKGNYKNGSDIDLTLIGSSDLNLTTLGKIMTDIDDLLLPYTVDLSLYNYLNDPDILDHIQRAGKIFYKKINYKLLRLYSPTLQ